MQQPPANKKKKKELFDKEGFKKGIAFVESKNFPNNPYRAKNDSSSASGKYQMLWNELSSSNPTLLRGHTRDTFLNTPDLQEKVMDMAITGGLKKRPSYYRNATDLTNEYKPKIKDWKFRPDEVAALSHFLGRGGARKYLRSLADNKPFKAPGINKTPEEYLDEYNIGQGKFNGPEFKAPHEQILLQPEDNNFTKGGSTDCGGPGQPPCQETKEFQKNFKNLYDPVYDKLKAIYSKGDNDKRPLGEMFYDAKVPQYNRWGLNDALDYSFEEIQNGRSIPPMNDTLKEFQQLILNTPNEELKELLSKDYSDTNLFNFKSKLPKGVGYLDALKYYKHFKKLRKEGYTFKDGGRTNTDPKKLKYMSMLSKQSPRTGVRQNKDGSHSTHLMGQSDNYAYPTLFQNKDGSWNEYSDHKKAISVARERGELFKFKDEVEARVFAEGAWKPREADLSRPQIQKDITNINQFTTGGQTNTNTMNNELQQIQGLSHEADPRGGQPIGMGANGNVNRAEKGETFDGKFVYPVRGRKISKKDIENYSFPKNWLGKFPADASLMLKDESTIFDKEGNQETLQRLQKFVEDNKPKVAEPQGNEFGTGGAANYAQAGLVGFDFLNQLTQGSGIDTTGNQSYGKANVGMGILGSAMKGAQAGSVVPGIGTIIGAGVGGIIGGFSGQERKDDIEKANNNVTFKARSEYGESDWRAYGGKVNLLQNGGPVSPFDTRLVKPENQWGGLNIQPNSQQPFDYSSFNLPDFNTFIDTPITGKTGTTPTTSVINTPGRDKEKYTINQIQSGTLDYQTPVAGGMAQNVPSVDITKQSSSGIGNWFGNNKDKIGNTATDFLRYAPAATDLAQLLSLKKPKGESLDRIDKKFKPNYVDERGLLNQVREQEGTTRNALKEASGGDLGALRTNLLASHLNSVKGRSGAFMQAENINRQQDMAGQEFNNRNDLFNIGQSNTEKDINARNIAAYDNNKSRMLSSLGQNIGGIGTENMRRKYPERAGLFYDWLGDYLDKEKGTQTT